MAPQDDLTAERVAALLGNIVGIVPMTEQQRATRVQWLVDYAKQTRQEALREGRDYALACVHERAVQLDGFTGSSEMAGVIRGKQSEAQRIADKLDRLASEGA